MIDRYAVIGNPVAHSQSPAIHAAFAAATGQDLHYGLLEAPSGGFAAAAQGFAQAGGRGLNVTAPFKLDAFAYATELREAARLAGAVNAMRFEGSRVVAENFDGTGLVADIQRNLDFALAGRRVLMLGAGGAVRGALRPLLLQQPAALVVANRTAEKAQLLASQFAAHGARAGGADRIRPGARRRVRRA